MSQMATSRLFKTDRIYTLQICARMPSYTFVRVIRAAQPCRPLGQLSALVSRVNGFAVLIYFIKPRLLDTRKRKDDSSKDTRMNAEFWNSIPTE